MRKLVQVLLLIIFTIASYPAQTQNGAVSSTQSSDASSNNGLVNLIVTVMSKRGRYILELPQSAFSITEGKTPQEIVSIKSGDEPASVAILIDASDSMNERGRQETSSVEVLRDAIGRFIDLSNSGNSYFLISFNERSRLLSDWTRDKDSILNKLGETPTKGQTALFDACVVAIEKLKQGEHRKQVILIISDGQDNTSKHSWTEIRKLIQESEVLIYGIASLNNSMIYGDSIRNIEGASILDEFATISGGFMFPPKERSELNKYLERTAAELRNQYRLSFRPGKMSQDGKWHGLKIRVNPPQNASEELRDIVVRSRAGYYLPKAQK